MGMISLKQFNIIKTDFFSIVALKLLQLCRLNWLQKYSVLIGKLLFIAWFPTTHPHLHLQSKTKHTQIAQKATKTIGFLKQTHISIIKG